MSGAPDEPERGITINTTIHGGQQAFASDRPTFIQHNYGVDRPDEDFRQALEEIRRRLDELSDPEPARRQVAVIEAEVANRSSDKSRALEALQRLATFATAGTALAEAVEKAARLVVRFWPFWT